MSLRLITLLFQNEGFFRNDVFFDCKSVLRKEQCYMAGEEGVGRYEGDVRKDMVLNRSKDEGQV
ncbi:MAG: hypothetical protein ACMUIM_06125 [bacterium]